MYDARLLECESAGVKSGKDMVTMSAYIDDTHILSSAYDVLVMNVVKSVGVRGE